MQAFDDMNLPLVIGEFGPVNNGQPVDTETVIAQARSAATATSAGPGRATAAAAPAST